MADPTFHQLRQWGRGRQAPAAPAIGQIDPDAISVLDGAARAGSRMRRPSGKSIRMP